MKWILLLMLAAIPAFAIEPATPEVDRLRRENAELRKQVAELKAEVAQLKAAAVAAKPPAPKATTYTAEQIVKLIPRDKSKASKVLEANLMGEWVRMEARIKTTVTADDKGNTGLFAFHNTAVDPNFFTDFRFAGKLSDSEKYVGKSVTVVGKVTKITIDNNMHIMLVLTECQLAK